MSDKYVYLLECSIYEGVFRGERLVRFRSLGNLEEAYRDPEEGYASLLTWTGNLFAFLDGKLVTRDELPTGVEEGYMRPSALKVKGDASSVMLSDNSTYSGVWFRINSQQLRPFSFDLVRDASFRRYR